MIFLKKTKKHTECILLILVLFFCLTSTSCAKADSVKIEKNEEGGYTLYVNQTPFLAKGVIYNPTPIGKGPGYDFFNHQPKPWMTTDGKLMKEMGVNAVRIYSSGDNLDATKEFIRDMHQNYGIYTAVSDWLGLWEQPRANYADPEFRKRTKERILETVKALKDEEGVLMWILGNENNYTFSGKIGFWTSPKIEKIDKIYKKQQRKAEIYYSFIDELAAEIKKIDPNHPVALGNGETSFLDIAAENCDNIDALAIIIYQGKTFGNLFENIRNIFDKPIVLSEFGCDSYDAYRQKEDQDVQSEFILSQWKKIYGNTTISGNETGNVLGGFVFEWTDEWWKFNEGYPEDWSKHNPEAGWSDGSYYYDIHAKHNQNMNEEWFGIVSLRKEKEDGLYKRDPKEAYYDLKEYFQKIEERRVLPAKE
ncbi:MAG: glycoside hydrolase family 2 TIM barrel-domain containing protein [Candidatus Omnitrophota bacterium]